MNSDTAQAKKAFEEFLAAMHGPLEWLEAEAAKMGVPTMLATKRSAGSTSASQPGDGKRMHSPLDQRPITG
jgi:hypothetical protein